MPKEFQENLKSNLQEELQEVEQRRHDLMPVHQKVQKRSHKIQSIQDNMRNMQKENVSAEEEIRKLRENVKHKEERIFSLSDKVERNKMADAEMAAELQGLQAGQEREAAMLRKRWIAAWRRWWNRSSLRDQIRQGLISMLCAKFSSRNSRPQPLRRRCQEKEGEGIVRTDKSKAKPVSSWRCQRQAGSVKALQRVVWSLIFLVFGVHMVNAEEQGIQVQQRIEKIFVELPKSTSSGRGYFTGGPVRGKGKRKPFVRDSKERKTARARTQEPFKKTANVGNLVHLKQTARERTREPLRTS